MLTTAQKQQRRARRTRFRIKRNADGRLRLSVNRSLKHISVQIIDDARGQTLASASTLEAEFCKKGQSGGNCAAAEIIGTWIAGRALEAGIEQLVFDRGSYLYHGRVRALADAARAGGLKF